MGRSKVADHAGFEGSRQKPSLIKNKMKRAAVMADLKHEKKKLKRKAKDQKKKLGDDAPAPKPQDTLETKRDADETMLEADDEEVEGEDRIDEYAAYFEGKETPKNMITTCIKPSVKTFQFIREFAGCIPNTIYYKRGTYEIKKICQYAAKHDFTNLILINEDKRLKTPCGLTVIKLPDGPTADFKLTRIKHKKNIKHHATSSDHHPEVLLNRFDTRLGHRLSRVVQAMYPLKPEFNGRRVVTFHNQRDFIFFRHHRYIFESAEKARLQEIGPRFTLKLKSLQSGTFDTTEGEYEWMHKSDMDRHSRTKFHL